LSRFLTKANKLKEDWRSVMDKPDKSLQLQYAREAKELHSEIEKYLQAIPRGYAYTARFNGHQRTVCAGYPDGHNGVTCNELEILDADIAALGEFMRDPDLGQP
jgi:hypothetical protein